MAATRTRQVDRFGNVSYAITRDGQPIGTVLKTSTGYLAITPTRSAARRTTSIKRGVAWLEQGTDP
jgi:hypothetical protein